MKTEENTPQPIKVNPNVGMNRKKKKISIKKTILYSFMSFVALLQIFPLIWLVNFSFLRSGEFFGDSFLKWPDEFQWINYINAFTQGNVPRYLMNSLFVTLVSVALAAIISVLMAYAFTRMKWKLNKVVMNIILLGMIIPIHATLLPNFILFNHFNLLDSPLSLILPYTAFSLPISMFIMSGFMETLPKELEESAVMDGAGLFSIIFRVIFPLTTPAIATISVLNFINWWNEFIMANTFLVSEEKKTLPFSIMKFAGEYSSNYGAQFAVMTIIVIPSIIIYVLFSKYITKGITAGAVKG